MLFLCAFLWRPRRRRRRNRRFLCVLSKAPVALLAERGEEAEDEEDAAVADLEAQLLAGCEATGESGEGGGRGGADFYDVFLVDGPEDPRVAHPSQLAFRLAPVGSARGSLPISATVVRLEHRTRGGEVAVFTHVPFRKPK